MKKENMNGGMVLKSILFIAIVMLPLLFFFLPYREMRDYIVLFVFVIFSSVLFFLSKSLMRREEELLDVKDTLSEDITKKVLVEKTLEEERKLNQIILDYQEQILILSTKKSGMININNKFFTTFDFKDLNDFKEYHQCICELFILKEGYLQKTEGSDWTLTVLNNPNTMHKALMLNKEGEETIFLARVKKVNVGEEEYRITTFTDITELEKAREMAESSERVKANFMANMSHELRTPLNGINGFTQLLSQTSMNEKQRKYISLIETSSKNLLGIVDNILDFSKIESGNMELESKQSNPFTEIENIINLFNARAKSKNITYQLDMDSNISPCLLMDTLRLSQILSNLISNAIKFTPENGKIIVEVKSLSKTNDLEKLYIAVTDNGIGISKERQQVIFKAFTQADTSTTREFGGTGLGLSISVTLVHLFGGTLQLESEENKGSRFFFDIEAKRCDQEEKKQKVLIVEECEMTKIVIEELLKQHEILVEFANDEENFLNKLSTEKYQLLFININMPNIDISKTLPYIRVLSPTLPIVALGDSEEDKNRVETVLTDINEYLDKPIQIELFNELIVKQMQK
ncbi:response regulator [bacterium]|nr:response regulator [bacterium]MBU1958843.1 response regulator [bacterium]